MKPIDGPFTHIIVGAGSAGCLLANRLSARPENNVLLVEAGGWDQGFWLKLPVGYFRSINNPSVSRHFATTPCEGTADRSIDWPRGKVVGGSSSINGLIFIRGQKDTVDEWAALGNNGWSFNEILPYFGALKHLPDHHHNIMEAMASFRSRNFAMTIPIARPGCGQPASLACPAMMISMVSPHMA